MIPKESKESIKKEIVKILSSIFGDDVKKIVEDNYDSMNSEELIELAHHMLSGYMGEKRAQILLDDLLKKFTKVKVKIP